MTGLYETDDDAWYERVFRDDQRNEWMREMEQALDDLEAERDRLDLLEERL